MHELRGGNEEEGPRRLYDGVLAAELRRPDEAQELVLGGLLERLHRRELRAARRERARLVDKDRIDAARGPERRAALHQHAELGQHAEPQLRAHLRTPRTGRPAFIPVHLKIYL
ncbi:hypothetical protein [Sorangium sp. So ce176]|uniref:hypothetical protein n=1 Tax=Sorangium sp. So ce176 TaxID=3133286 RepID=UPI003F5EDA85